MTVANNSILRESKKSLFVVQMVYSNRLFCAMPNRAWPITVREPRIMAPEVLSEADFRALGLEPGAKPSEVRQAYRTLVKKWHPDRHHLEPYETRAFAEKKFREIDEAYRRISESWGKTPKSRHFAKYKDFGTAGPAAAKVRAAASSRSRAKFNIHFFSEARFVLPALLSLAAAVFILTLLPSFFTDTGADRTAPVQRTVERSHVTEETNTVGPPKAPGPQSLANLAAPSSPVLSPAHPQPKPAAPRSFFTLGSTASEVLNIQGTPSRVQGRTWIYGLSDIRFKNGRVSGYNDFDGSLRVRMQPRIPRNHPTDHITIGSSKHQVLLVQGTPTRVEGNRWFYGFAELVFKNGRVAGYDNYFGTLKMRLLPSAAYGRKPPGNSFTIGSTPDEVLAVQGTPTAIHGNRWSFNFDFVFFRDGKVKNVINSDGDLRYTAPEKTSDAGMP